MASFDPYYLWLSIPPGERPLCHYRLLGVARFEPDVDVIAMAAQRQIAFVKSFAFGEHAELAERIQNELAMAKVCLVEPEQRKRYDAELRSREAPAPPARPARSARRRKEAPNREPAPALEAAQRSWIIGSSRDCDVVVNWPTVSGHHCRLIQTARGVYVEDLESRNGVYVNGTKIAERTAITTVDTIRMGKEVPLPWPRGIHVPGARIIHVGAAPDNDVVVALPMVSAYHAVVTIENGIAVLEDLGSTNGTALNDPQKLVRRSVILAADTVYLGGHAVPGRDLMKG